MKRSDTVRRCMLIPVFSAVLALTGCRDTASDKPLPGPEAVEGRGSANMGKPTSSRGSKPNRPNLNDLSPRPRGPRS